MAEKRKDFSDTMRVQASVDDLVDGTPREHAYLIVLAGNTVGAMFKLDRDGMLIGRTVAADVRLHDDGISRKHARIRLDGGRVLIEDLGSQNGTYLNGERVDSRRLTDGDKIQIGGTTVMKFTYHDELDETFSQNLYESAMHDGLTKAFNRRFLLDRLDGDVSFALRHNSPLSVVMLDLDHFKQINDTHGHLAGDQVLVEMSECIRGQIRKEDVFVRYGGEEFVIACRGIPQDNASALAERLRVAIESLVVEHRDVEIRFTASFGVAGFPEVKVTRPAELIAAADKALYAAKQAGRNRVIVAGSEG